MLETSDPFFDSAPALQRLNMNWFQDVTAILLVSVASMQLGLFLAWGFLTLLLNSLRPINIQANK